MHCRRARAAITERTLGRPDRDVWAALRDHLRRCRRCAGEARAATRIVAGLAELAQVPPLAVDVRRRLAAEIGGLPPPRTGAVPAAQLGWAALVGAAVAAALLAWLWFLGPQIPRVAAELGLLAEALGTALASIAAALSPLLALPRTLAGGLVDLLAGPAALVGRLQPVAIGLVALGYAAVGCTIVYVVGREMRGRPVWVAGEGQTR